MRSRRNEHFKQGFISLQEALQAKLLEADEKVRAAVCRLYTQIDYETALHHVSVQQLKNVAGRGLDKKVLLLAHCEMLSLPTYKFIAVSPSRGYESYCEAIQPRVL